MTEEIPSMAEKQKLVILITRGLDDERSSVAWSIANAGIASDFEVTVFLAASGVDWVRKGAADVPRLNPLDPPLKEMIGNLISNGATILVCPPCAKVRGYAEGDLIEKVTVAGAPAMLEVVKQGAATLSF
jgi:predicted peroxiredoxin